MNTDQSSVRKILPGMAWDGLRHGGGSLLVKLVRVLQEILVAAVLAVQGSMDGWLAAYALASVPVNLLLHAYQPPLVARWASTSPGPTSLRRVLSEVLLAGLVGAACVAGAGPTWFSHALTSPAARQASLDVLPVLVFFVVASAVNVGLNGILQARGRFFAAGALPISVPLAIIVALAVFPAEGVRALAWGLAIGAVLETLCSAIALGVSARVGASTAASTAAFFDAWRTAGSSVVWREAMMLLPGVACASLVPLAEQYFASRAGGEGGVAVLGYAQRLPFFLAGTLSLSLSAVGTTTLARLASRASLARSVLVRAGVVLAAGSSLLVLPLALGAHPLTTFIFERGAFDRTATAAVAAPMAWLLAGLPFLLLRLLALRALTVHGLNGLAAAVQALGFLLVVAANVACLRLGLGVAGVAAASSVAMLLGAWLAWVLALRVSPEPENA